MQPTTILIEREADAKVFEVIEQVYPDVKWTNGKEKPTDYIPHKQPDPHKHIDDSDFPYVVSIIDDELTTDGRGRKHITASEWLAQHGYVWDGKQYRENIAASVYPADRNYVAPVSAPTSTEQEPLIVTMEKQKQATIDKIKLSDRIGKREKDLIQREYAKEQDLVWRHKFANGYVRSVGENFVHHASNEQWNNFITEHDEEAPKHQPQPAPYTAGQEVEVLHGGIWCKG